MLLIDSVRQDSLNESVFNMATATKIDRSLFTAAGDNIFYIIKPNNNQ